MRLMPSLDQFNPNPVILDYSKVGKIDKFEPAPDPFIDRYAGKIYYDPWQGIDFTPNPWLTKNRALERAIWAFESESTTVPKILPTFLDPSYTYALPSDAPAFASLPRKASKGAHEDYVRVTAHGAPTSIWVSETEAQTPEYTSPTTARVSEAKKIAEVWGGVTGFQQAAAESYKDMFAEAHAERLMYLLTNGLEDGVLNGAGSGTAMKGLLTWQGTTNGVGVGGDGTEVTLKDIQEAVRNAWKAGGDLNSYGFAITDPRTYDYVKNLVAEYMGYVNVENYNLPWGLKTYDVEGIPFIKSRKMPQTTNAAKILFVDSRYSYVAVLRDVQTEVYGKVDDAQKFAIKFYGATINRAPELQSVVYGCAHA